MEQKVKKERIAHNQWRKFNDSTDPKQAPQHFSARAEAAAEGKGLERCLCNQFERGQKVIPASNKRRHRDQEKIKKKLLEW